MPKRKHEADKYEVELLDLGVVPPGPGGGNNWPHVLQLLVENPGQWAKIYVADTPSQAYHTQSNLQRRKIKIPMADGDWTFLARGCELYAIYRGGVKRRGNVLRAPMKKAAR